MFQSTREVNQKEEFMRVRNKEFNKEKKLKRILRIIMRRYLKITAIREV
jgi:hypothetical protein